MDLLSFNPEHTCRKINNLSVSEWILPYLERINNKKSGMIL